MAAMNRTIFWDFDGTLGRRTGSMPGIGGGLWAPSLIEVLEEEEPGHGIDPEAIRPQLRGSFPWHQPEEAHPELSDPDAWWTHVTPLFVRAFEAVGIDSARARELAVRVRERYVDPACWALYPDVVPVLEELAAGGWRHVILSNHVPELEDIVRALGLAKLVEATVNSALTGYEKPHPEAFEVARRLAGHPDEVWMVGDNPEADVRGAEDAGIPAILVRRDPVDTTRRHAPNLEGAAAIIQRSSGPF